MTDYQHTAPADARSALGRDIDALRFTHAEHERRFTLQRLFVARVDALPISDMHKARMIIANAIIALGELSRGQRRDLLKDNLPWPSDRCDDAEALVHHYECTHVVNGQLLYTTWEANHGR